MSRKLPRWAGIARWVLFAVPLFIGFLLGNETALGGFIGARFPAVGGVWINAEGVLAEPQVGMMREMKVARERAMAQVPGDMNAWTDLRKVSLRRLELAIQDLRNRQFPRLPQDIQFLAGLQRIQYVFVFPEENDIILAGPAEGWQVDSLGNVVGRTTGRPVLLLDDLMVAMRTAASAAPTGISCSIDPTAEGIRRLDSLTRQIKSLEDPRRVVGAVEEALGPQMITIRGIPETTHFARVLVAADFRMKRLAMDLERPPIAGMPSYLQLMQAGRRGMQSMLPRWWLAPYYEPLRTDQDGLSWEIRGQAVQCMTEDDLVRPDGSRSAAGRGHSASREWARSMTERFEELAAADSVFGQLRNLMDLAVVAALIDRENLLTRAGINLPHLFGVESLASFDAPRRVASQASFMQKGRNWVISASGGVQILPHEVLQNTETTDALAPLRQAAQGDADRWWWN
jgi:hypothetical protein